MKYFDALTADNAWQQAVIELTERPDYKHMGRNGETREILPCVLRIKNPRQRWILSRRPPYNPAFGLVEFIWIITGHNESRVINYWNPSLPKYNGADDCYHGAYGYRLRHSFDLDQIERAYHALSNAPESRQILLQIWDPEIDLPTADGQPVSKDIPCNVMSLLKIRGGRLHWTQIMRSNDVMRGLPYNLIQFTMLQEVIAGWLGVLPGDYIHFSDSLHVYEKDLSEFSSIHTAGKSFDCDQITVTYEESIELFGQIYDDLADVSGGKKNEDELSEIFSRDCMKNVGRCNFIKDLMAVIGSDAARRMNYWNLSYSLVNSCVDYDLKNASYAWLKYQEGKNEHR